MANDINLIKEELEKTEEYFKSIAKYLDENPVRLAEDRFGEPTGRYGDVKCISKKEDQVKAFMALSKELPKVLKELLDLRKSLSGIQEKPVPRGEQSIPDFMKDDDDDDDDDPPLVTVPDSEEDNW